MSSIEIIGHATTKMRFVKKLLAKPYTCCMERYNDYGCYISIVHPSVDSIEGFKKFFAENHFLIAHNMFDEKWDEKTKLEEIYKKLLLIYEFDPNDKNICIVHKKHKRIYFSDKLFVPLPSRSIFVYDSSKVNVFF